MIKDISGLNTSLRFPNSVEEELAHLESFEKPALPRKTYESPKPTN